MTLAQAESQTNTSAPTQSDNQLAAAVSQTLAQFGVNINNYSLSDLSSKSEVTADNTLLQRFDVVQFVGSLFQTLGSIAPPSASASTAQTQSIYVQALNSLAASARSNPTSAPPTPSDAIATKFGDANTYANFLQALASNLASATPDAPVGVFVQTTV
jgi:hypothetical protein